MQYRHLGKSGLIVSAISYGNWLTHGSQVEEDQAIECVKTALDQGITTFDTADVYANTRAEVVLGKALKGLKREAIEVFTKVYWPTGNGKNERGLSKKHIIESCNASLKRLGLDYVDLYQAHRYDYETPLDETLEAFEQLQRVGKVLYVGVSEWTADQIQNAVQIADKMGYRRIISNQPQYSMLWRVIEEKVVPVCDEFGIGQIVWSPLAQGVLTGKYKKGEKPPEKSRATDPVGGNFISRFLRDEILEKVAELKSLSDELNVTLGQLAIAWVLSRPGVSSAIVGATKPEQIIENVKATELSLSDEVVRRIDDILDSVVVRDPDLTQSPLTRP
jgi:voltage-dependent potassium channel beta subunit